MTTLNVQVSEEVAAKQRARAAATGSASIGAFVNELIRDEIKLMDLGHPREILDSGAPDLEDKLVERMNGPRADIEATPAFWAGLKQRARERGGDTKQP